jgi:ADP-ribose pyrophosphatase YjhB (NUDIX family)
MISVQLNGQRFQIRAAAVVIDSGHLLVHRAMGDKCWSLPGGRVEMGEAASDAVLRELKEELDEQVACGELLYVAENFFESTSQRHHEIGFYFLVSLPESSRFLDKSKSHAGLEDHGKLEFRWIALTDLGSIDLRPTFLKTSLAENPRVFSHKVQREHTA